MDFFKWKDSFDIGIQEIDQQHRTFLEYLNDCYRQKCGENRSEIKTDLIDRLKTYAATHFLFEENLMRSKGYKDVEQYKKQHSYFESQVKELEVSYSGPGGKTPESLLTFLRDWFLRHILEEDKRFALSRK